MAENLLYLTELVGLKVYDLKGRRIGRVKDAALVPLIDPARVDRYLVGGGWAWLTVRHDQVRSISLDGIYLRDELLTPYHDDEYMLRSRATCSTSRSSTSHGRKVVRVTDVTFEHRDARTATTCCGCWKSISGCAASSAGCCRASLPPRWVRRLQRAIPPNSIRWEFCNIVEADPQRRLRLNISHAALEKLHPADLADIVEELSPEDREAIFETIDSEVAAEALSEVEPKMQASILESLETEKAADIVEEMAPDEAADVLAELEEETSEEILEEMETRAEDRGPGTARVRGGHRRRPDEHRVRRAPRGRHRGRRAWPRSKGNEELLESLNTLFLVDAEERLAGVVPAGAPVRGRRRDAGSGSCASETLIKVPVDEKQERVTELFDKYNLLTLPVVDEEGKLAGVITADDIISVLRQK